MTFDSKNVQPEDLLLIRELLSNQVVSAFTLHGEFQLSVDQVVRLVEKFSEQEIVTVDRTESNDVNLVLTEAGRAWVRKNENWLIQGSSDRYWKAVPEEFRQPKLEYDQNYELENQDILEFFGD